jgi:Domain of Unknown Function (DUF1080)
MRRVLILSLVLSLSASARAADASAKPNTLTPKEVAEGWILLFDGETTFGWRSPNESKWTVADGMLAPQAEKPGLLVTTSSFKDYDLSFECQVKDKSPVELRVHCNADGQVVWPRPKHGEDPIKFAEGIVAQFRPEGLRSLVPGYWTRGVIHVLAGRIVSTAYVAIGGGVSQQGKRVNSLKEDYQEQFGYIALAGNGVVFRNIKLKPTNTKSLFNGKDLSGWKEFPDKKSKFDVTKEGWIHLHDGPGDLQTEGQWADFVLQLDCISNGDHCNSGVFFRCIPGEFENGYEAQIRNEFTPEPKQEYTIEEYDPKTHELKGTKKQKYTAVDYGTGAIYRRAPARKELSKDREWFGMTIVASGRHIATWVNGVQAVDWTDERPIAENPRKGCRLEKGAISLQGHEAAVEDLNFANIRIQDLTATEEKKP